MSENVTDEMARYVLRYGGMCRDCADEDGTCPTSGMPCDGDQRRAVVKHTINALSYGIKHGLISNPFPTPIRALTSDNVTDKMVEAAAKAMHSHGDEGAWNAASAKDYWRGYAREALEAVLSAGQTQEPTAYYCTDCETHISQIHNGRCGCGSGRVVSAPPPVPVSSQAVEVRDIVSLLERYADERLRAHLSECDDSAWPTPRDITCAREAAKILRSALVAPVAEEGASK